MRIHEYDVDDFEYVDISWKLGNTVIGVNSFKEEQYLKNI